MVVSLSALRTRRTLLSRNIFMFMFLLLISVSGLSKRQGLVRPEGLGIPPVRTLGFLDR
jgi:hypothetical protein